MSGGTRDGYPGKQKNNMKYNATLERKYYQAPVVVILELEIPDDLDDEARVIFAAHELMKPFVVNIDPIKDENPT